MDQALSPEPVRTSSQEVPAWVIDRAAAYMMRRYGKVAMRRAVSRRRFLSQHGEAEAAVLWSRVADAIRASTSIRNARR
jgi:hypothetical protein